MSTTLTVANNARVNEGNTWKWQMLVTTEVGIFTTVVLHLHPTFRNNRIEINNSSDGVFKSGIFTGWGTFTVGVDLHWIDGTISSLEHNLIFEQGEHGADHTLQLPASLLLAPEAEAEPEPSMIEVDDSPVIPSTLQRDVPDRAARIQINNVLKNSPFTDPDDPKFMHGRGYVGPLVPPARTWDSSLKPRDDHEAPEWLTASEFTDVEAVLDSKLEQLATLLRLSSKTVVYSGAGISRAAGIGQAARGASGGGGKSTDALPTFTHYALGALSKAGLLHGWVQQNHDGLPQKAGFPQEKINEIHGSWYDPSNPVVKYSGELKDDAYPWMQDDAATADLVLVLGTSLGGLNADQVAVKTASRSLKGKSLGMVMINLQQTNQDGKASLRLFGKSDDVLQALLSKIGINPGPLSPATFTQEPRVLVPYDANGKRSKTARMWLDLRDGAKVKLSDGHNIQGAKQPVYMHIGNTTKKTVNGRRCGPGHGRVVKWDDKRCAISLEIEGVRMTLGQWWIEAAIRGGPETLPVLNLKPQMQSQTNNSNQRSTRRSNTNQE